MLTEKEVKAHAHMRRLRLLDQIWKDYLQDLLLHLLYRKIPKLIFSGGTCIWKIMKGDRFSEDIDAYATSVPMDIEDYLKKEFALLGVDCRILKKKQTANMFFLSFALSFAAHPRELMLSVEILLAKPKHAERATLYSPYPDVPPVELIILSPAEMLANKVAAIYKRNRPRDVHDVYFLLKIGTPIDMQSIRTKVPKFGLRTFEDKIMEKRAGWRGLEPLIVTKLPDFKIETQFILSCFARAAEKTNSRKIRTC